MPPQPWNPAPCQRWAICNWHQIETPDCHSWGESKKERNRGLWNKRWPHQWGFCYCGDYESNPPFLGYLFFFFFKFTFVFCYLSPSCSFFLNFNFGQSFRGIKSFNRSSDFIPISVGWIPFFFWSRQITKCIVVVELWCQIYRTNFFRRRINFSAQFRKLFNLCSIADICTATSYECILVLVFCVYQSWKFIFARL